MDRLRFRRSSRKDSPPRPSVVTDGSVSGKTTPEPIQPLQIPKVPNKKGSPFHSLHHFSRTHKRARSPPPASLPQSPTAAIHAPDHPASSPISLRKSSKLSPENAQAQPGQGAEGMDSLHGMIENATGRRSKIPSFLALSPQQIEAKFQELIWLERGRMAQSMANPSPDFKWARVHGEHLKKLDRYMNIQPWHNHRIKLKVPPGRIDYINASPIKLTSTAGQVASNGGSETGRASPADLTGTADQYIAMQGPKLKTVDHVWRMVVEQLDSPGVIVMLTETFEGNAEKCYPYFPRIPGGPALEINKRDEFGDGFRASVRCEAIEETPAGDAIELRKLVVRVRKARKHSSDRQRPGGDMTVAVPPPTPPTVDENGDVKMMSPQKVVPEEARAMVEDDVIADADADQDEYEYEYEERIIWHFLYKKWPDFGVPVLEDLDSFFMLMRLSREKNANPGNPRIVHCSAGVGRSGTFIALEHLIRELDAGVLEHWDHSRLQRALADSVADHGAGGGGGDGGRSHESFEVEGEDLIFNTVNQLREQRRTMVQAEQQFLFIYQVMRKLWQDKYGIAEEDEPAAKRLEFDPFVEE